MSILNTSKVTINHRIELWVVLTICILSIILSATLSGLCFKFSCIERDTASYLFQAKLFAHGRLFAEPPPEYGFTASPHVNINNGKWYSKYQFGNALMLTPGVLVDAPWLTPAILTGLTLVFLYLIVREIYDKRIAMLAMILGCISPATLIMGATWFSENVSRFYLSIYLFALIKMLKNGRWFYAALSGFALGYAFNTRPYQAFVFGLAGAGLTLYFIVRSHDRGMVLKKILVFLIPLSMLIGLFMAWNNYFTGNPLKPTFNFMQPYDKIGFGKRSEGYEPDPKKIPAYTMNEGIRKKWLYALPCVSSNTLGWGYYAFVHMPGFSLPIKNSKFSNPIYIWILALLLLLPFILMLIPIFHSSRNRYDIFFLTLFLLIVLFLLFEYFDPSGSDFSALCARYYSECILLGIIPLLARGIGIFYEWIKGFRSLRLLVLLGVVSSLLSINTIYSYVCYIRLCRSDCRNIYRDLPKLIEKQKVHHAVVFIPNGIDAPMGDYPFQSLNDVDVVYFKLGPSKTWKLTNTDWRKVYMQYFQGRHIYIIHKLGNNFVLQNPQLKISKP